jgi:hypothetical protein
MRGTEQKKTAGSVKESMDISALQSKLPQLNLRGIESNIQDGKENNRWENGSFVTFNGMIWALAQRIL